MWLGGCPICITRLCSVAARYLVNDLVTVRVTNYGASWLRGYGANWLRGYAATCVVHSYAQVKATRL